MEQDEDISLPVDTLKILQEFLAEKAQREQSEIEHIENKAGKNANFEEDWQLSQFWYSAETKSKLGKVVTELVNDLNNAATFSIALLSCPSLYKTVKDIQDNVKIFEYDRRFAAFGDDFVFYDFNEGSTPNYLAEHASTYDLVIADPPFLSEECITKVSHIIKNIQKPNSKIIFCSGEVVAPIVEQTLCLKKCLFRPEHERNLGNEFSSYANFDLDAFINKI